MSNSRKNPIHKGYVPLPDEIHDDIAHSEPVSDVSNEVAERNGYTTFLNSPFYIAIKNALKSSKNAFQTIINAGGGDLKDFVDTIWRLFQVFSNIVANKTNDCSDSKDGEFIKKTKVNGPDSSLNTVGEVFFITSIVALVAGSIKVIYQGFRNLTLGGYSYLLRQLNKISQDKLNKANVDQTINSLIERDKVYSRLYRKSQKLDRNGDPLDVIETSKESFGFFDFINLFDGKTHLFKNYEKNKRPSLFARLIGTASLAVKSLWNFVGNNAFVFWLVWFPFVLAVGTAAATTSMFFVPIILCVTFGITLAFTVWKVVERIKHINNMKRNDSKEKNEKIEHDRMVKDLKQRVYMKEEHRLMMAILGGSVTSHKAKKSFVNEETNQIKITKDAINNFAEKPIIQLERSKEEVLNSRLGKYLLNGSKRRIGFAVGMEIASGLVVTSMVFWLISTVALVAAGGAVANLVFAFFDSGVNAAIAGGIVSGFFSLRKIAEMRKSQKEFEDKIHARLTEAYKPEKPENKGVTKAEKFAEMELAVELKKAQVELLRLKKLIALAAGHNSKALTAAHELVGEFDANGTRLNLACKPKKLRNEFKIINSAYEKLYADLKRAGKPINDKSIASGYDIKKIDVYNDYYFEKQKDKATLWTNVKKGCNRAYAFLSGGQSGIFIVRTLFLVGGICAAACTGAPLVFFGIAAVGALVIGTIKLVQYCLERKRQKRENFVNTIDARISYLRKKEKELDALEVVLDPSKSKDQDKPAPASHAIDVGAAPKAALAPSAAASSPIISSAPSSLGGGIYPDIGQSVEPALTDASEINDKVCSKKNSTATITSALTENVEPASQLQETVVARNKLTHAELVEPMWKSTSSAQKHAASHKFNFLGGKPTTQRLHCDEEQGYIRDLPNNGIAAA